MLRSGTPDSWESVTLWALDRPLGILPFHPNGETDGPGETADPDIWSGGAEGYTYSMLRWCKSLLKHLRYNRRTLAESTDMPGSL
ncbi:hypothetical protein Moror_7168 [Moniliophthora roreri MCA 2997]|uniref:Uncharacterized protein n=1 Tax=Moniliophthora roreri (strain MCA 2997) TaxID=1381753 RepID=V2XRL5_MONRO|nr:hypothetical protein Moror_7168 [Moniliophthora roreri MCA 2997]